MSVPCKCPPPTSLEAGRGPAFLQGGSSRRGKGGYPSVPYMANGLLIGYLSPTGRRHLTPLFANHGTGSAGKVGSSSSLTLPSSTSQLPPPPPTHPPRVPLYRHLTSGLRPSSSVMTSGQYIGYSRQRTLLATPSLYIIYLTRPSCCPIPLQGVYDKCTHTFIITHFSPLSR